MRDKFNDLFLKIDQDPKWKLFGVLFLAVLMAILMFRLNHPTPWVVDDILKGEGVKQIHSFKDYLKNYGAFIFLGAAVFGANFLLTCFCRFPSGFLISLIRLAILSLLA